MERGTPDRTSSAPPSSSRSPPSRSCCPPHSNRRPVGRPAAPRPYDRWPRLNLPATLAPKVTDLGRPTSGEYGLRFQICGRLAVVLGGKHVGEAELAGRQGHRLWTYLVLNRSRPVGRDELAAAVWSDDLPDAWDEALSALASRIRAALRPITQEAPALQIQHATGRYMLETPAGTFVDHERARAALHEAELASRKSELARTWTEARVALEICRRGFLAGDEAPWIIGQRRLLLEVTHRAFELLTSADLERGRPEDAATSARQLVELDPLRESGYRLLMRALAANGARTDAFRLHERCRRTLPDVAAAAPSR